MIKYLTIKSILTAYRIGKGAKFNIHLLLFPPSIEDVPSFFKLVSYVHLFRYTRCREKNQERVAFIISGITSYFKNNMRI